MADNDTGKIKVTIKTATSKEVVEVPGNATVKEVWELKGLYYLAYAEIIRPTFGRRHKQS